MPVSPKTVQTDYSVQLNRIIEDFFSRSSHKAASISPYYQDLWKELTRLVESGGKRLRPKMTLLAYQAFGGNDVESIIPAAAAQELLHFGMLIHDDIIDRDYIRYGVDNIAGSYQSKYETMVKVEADRRHYVHSAAMMAGDLMISGAYQLMAESAIEPAKILEAQKLLSKGIFEVVGGELLDTETAFREQGFIKAETVALYKTASYTFIVPMLIGSLLADAPKTDQAYLRLFAENLGIAFQLQDDIIGVFGNEEDTGKSTTSDIQEGKRTFMIEQFYLQADEGQVAIFDRHFGNQSATAEEVAVVRQLLIDSGARQKTEEAIARYEVKARSALDSLMIDHVYVQQLDELITIATRRVK